jgi:hypothetical protein
LLGGAIGATIHTDQWAPLPTGMRVAVVPMRKGGVFTMSIAF